MALVKVKRRKSLKIPRRDMRDAVRNGSKAGAHHFRRTMLPTRFTKRGATLLGYAPRSGQPGSGRAFRGSYSQRKLKEHGHTKPLVWSGDSERASRSARVDAKTKNNTGTKVVAEANVVFPSPNLNYKNPKSKAHPSEEIKRVAPSEIRELSRVSGKAMDRSLSRRLRKRK